MRVDPNELQPGAVLGDDGRYRIDRRLGQGTFGRVFLAEDGRLSRLCVVKQLLLDSSWPAPLARQVRQAFATEARLLASLATPGHPNIPEIYDHLDDRLCLVMKYVQGETLDERLARRATPLPEEQALRYARDICAALVYMHVRREPVLHLDLKPKNLMLDQAGTIWLIDFGLARRASRGEGSTAALSGGTPGFSPPEQWRGAAEPRSDIYALGATLYFLLTLQAPPVRDALAPLRQLNPTVRPEVEALVARAMAPAVGDRPTASDLLAELDGLLTAPDNLPPEPEQPPLIAPLSGRARELEQLTRALEASRVVALTGMAGIGKTALAASLARRHPRPEHTFWHTFRAGEGVDSLIWCLATWVAQLGRPDVWRRLRGARQHGSALTPDLIADYLVQLLRAPDGLICLDDLHLAAADPAVLRVVARLAQAAHTGGPALLLAARALPPGLEAPPTITLSGLSQVAAGAMLGRTGLLLPMPLVERLAAHTEGNPQLLTLAARVLRRAADPAAIIARLHESAEVEGYLLSEVHAGLRPIERRVMEAVAIFQGHGGTQQALGALLGRVPIARTLKGLAGQHLLSVEPRADGPVYRQHATLQEFYYAGLSHRRRRELHARAADHYADLGRDLLGAGRHYALAGRPALAATTLTRDVWTLIGQGAAAGAYTLLADLPVDGLAPGLRAEVHTALGELMIVRGDYDAALAALERAAAAGAPADLPVRQARRHRLMARAYARTGNFGAAEQHCGRGLSYAAAPGPVRTETARLYEQRAEVRIRRGALAEARADCLEGLAALPPQPAALSERGALLGRLATVAGQGGAYREAISLLEQSLALARQANDPVLMAMGLHNLGNYFQLSGKSEQALACFTESLHLSEQIGDLGWRLMTINNLGWTHKDHGARDQARQHFAECHALAERFGLTEAAAVALQNLGQLLLEQRELDEAAERLGQANQCFEQLGSTDGLANCRYLLGDVALARGDLAAAEAHGARSLALARQAGSQALAACALRVLGEAHLARGELPAAEAALAEAWRMQEELGDPYDQALIQAARANLALAQGDKARAAAEARASLAVARARRLPALTAALEAVLARAEAGPGTSPVATAYTNSS